MKKLLGAATIGGLLCASGAHASDGTITFNGKVTASTCTVSITGTGVSGDAKSPTVALPTMAAGNLAASGNTAGSTAIKFNLASCNDGAATNPGTLTTGTVKALFEVGPNIDSATGYLKNTATGTTAATNVQLQVLNNNSEVVKFGDAGTMTAATIGDGKAELQYSVRYIATGAATAGAVSSAVTYSLIYP